MSKSSDLRVPALGKKVQLPGGWCAASLAPAHRKHASGRLRANGLIGFLSRTLDGLLACRFNRIDRRFALTYLVSPQTWPKPAPSPPLRAIGTGQLGKIGFYT